MRRVMSRSIIVSASLAVASAAITALPAAAAPSAVTRAEVLAVAAAVRAETPTASPGAYSAGTLQAIQALADKACSVELNPGHEAYGVGAASVQAGQGADGLVVHANIRGPQGAVHRCSFGAVASTADSSALSGSALLGQVPSSLSGEVTVTPPIFASSSNPGDYPAFRTSGQSIQTIKTVTSKKQSTPKSSKQKKYAKKKYVKRIKSAKKSYAKALKRAGGSKSNKAAAKKSYVKKRSTAKASYRKAIAKFKIVKKTTVRRTGTPFDLSAVYVPTYSRQG